MEYAENGELFQYIKKNKRYGSPSTINQLRLPEKQAARLYHQLLETLRYLHNKGICHRDIKPQNILMTSNHDIKLVDFGLSTHFDSNKRLNTSCGSPCYALPEMLLGGAYDGKQADVWSSGVVLFTMTNGYLPFEDQDIKALYKSIMMNEIEFLSDISKDLKELISNILNKVRASRYNIQQITYHRWLVQSCGEYYKVIEDPKPVINEEVLQQLTTYGVEPEYVRVCLEKRKHNFATTIYYLVEKRLSREVTAKSVPSTVVSLKDQNLFAESAKFNLELSQFTQRTPANQHVQQVKSHIRLKKASHCLREESTIRGLKSAIKITNTPSIYASPPATTRKKETSMSKIVKGKSPAGKSPSSKPKFSSRQSPIKKQKKEGEYFTVACNAARPQKKKVTMYQKMESVGSACLQYQGIPKSPKHQKNKS